MLKPEERPEICSVQMPGPVTAKRAWSKLSGPNWCCVHQFHWPRTADSVFVQGPKGVPSGMSMRVQQSFSMLEGVASWRLRKSRI